MPKITENLLLDTEKLITDFHLLYTLLEQESLGKEFEQILYDNLWDLYIRSYN